MPTGLDSIRVQRRADGKEHRGVFVLSAVVFLLLLVFQVCYRGKDAGFVNPLDALVNIVTWVRLSFSDLFSLSYYDNRDEIIAGLNYYAETVIRLRSALLIIASGAVLAVSGCIYQAAMRNSMAVPTMLGVSSGVNLGKILLVWQFGEQVYFLTTQRYIYCYGIAAAVLVIVLAGGKLVGGKRSSVADMLIVGTIVNRMISTVVNYIRTSMDTDVLAIYQEFSEKSYSAFNSIGNLLVLCGVSVIVLLPVYLMRYSYNAVCFDDSDARTLGLKPSVMRLYGLVAGAILTTAAMIHCGNIGMISLVIPHLCRYLFGAEFKRLFHMSAFYGALLLLASQVIAGFIYFDTYQIPLGSVISVLAMPILMWAMFRQRRGWE